MLLHYNNCLSTVSVQHDFHVFLLLPLFDNSHVLNLEVFLRVFPKYVTCDFGQQKPPHFIQIVCLVIVYTVFVTFVTFQQLISWIGLEG